MHLSQQNRNPNHSLRTDPLRALVLHQEGHPYRNGALQTDRLQTIELQFRQRILDEILEQAKHIHDGQPRRILIEGEAVTFGGDPVGIYKGSLCRFPKFDERGEARKIQLIREDQVPSFVKHALPVYTGDIRKVGTAPLPEISYEVVRAYESESDLQKAAEKEKEKIFTRFTFFFFSYAGMLVALSNLSGSGVLSMAASLGVAYYAMKTPYSHEKLNHLLARSAVACTFGYITMVGASNLIHAFAPQLGSQKLSPTTQFLSTCLLVVCWAVKSIKESNPPAEFIPKPKQTLFAKIKQEGSRSRHSL